MTVTQEQLVEKWKEAIAAQNRSSRLASEFNSLLMQASEERFVPPGYAIDYLGDDKVKPTAEIRKTLKEP